MTFEEWYKERNPDLNPVYDGFYEELKAAYEAGHIEGQIKGIKECTGLLIIAFRVTKVYEEPKVPREYWLEDGHTFTSLGDARLYNRVMNRSNTDIIHVREVLPE